MRKLVLLFLTILDLHLLISCSSSLKESCDLPVPDFTIAKIIEKVILEDTLTVSQDLFKMYAQKKYLNKDRIGLPSPDTFINMKLEKLRFGNDSLAFLSIRKLYPYLSSRDSIYIRCQMNSDSTSKMINGGLLSLKNLNEIDNSLFESLFKEDQFKKYPVYYTFSKPFFFNNHKLCFIDARWHCGLNCGDFCLILLAYRNGEWIVSDRLFYVRSQHNVS